MPSYSESDIGKGLVSIHGELGTKRQPYVPPTFGRTPTTPAEALDAAACVLEEEGRWVRSEWFGHENIAHPDYQDNPFCNGWGTCAEGALQIVTIGAVYVEPRTLSGGACTVENCPTCLGHWDAPHNTAPDDSSVELAPEVALFHRARGYVHELLRTEYHMEPQDTYLPRFNDTVAQGRDEVIALFRKAQQAAELDEQGGNTEDSK